MHTSTLWFFLWCCIALLQNAFSFSHLSGGNRSLFVKSCYTNVKGTTAESQKSVYGLTMSVSHRYEQPAPAPSNSSTQSAIQKVKSLLQGKGWNGRVSKDVLTKLGLNVLLAYGFVSNVSYVTCVVLAWVSHGRIYGKSPLAPGQWKALLLIYSGFFAANNVIRPLRFSFSLLLSPFFDAQILKLRRRFGLSRAAATGVLVFLVNVVGTLTYLVVGLTLATRYAGVPLLP